MTSARRGDWLVRVELVVDEDNSAWLLIIDYIETSPFGTQEIWGPYKTPYAAIDDLAKMVALTIALPVTS